MAYLTDLTEFLKLVLWTGYVAPHDDCKTVSVMIVTKEDHDLSLPEQLSDNDGILYESGSGKHIFDHDREKMIKGVYKHIIIKDFGNTIVLSKKRTFDTLTNIEFFNCYISEGISTCASINLRQPIHGGLVTSLSDTFFFANSKRLVSCSLLSKMMVVSYGYSRELNNSFLSDIAPNKEKIRLSFPNTLQEITIDEKLSKSLNNPAEDIGRRLNKFGFCALPAFNSLVKASALSNGRDHVTSDDIDRVVSYADDYVGMSFNPIGPNGKVSHRVQSL